eukprot:s221_g21.t1
MKPGTLQPRHAEDLRQEKHLTSLRDALQDRHIQLTEALRREETQHQMDGVLRGALDQLERAQSRKLEFLQSMKRQVTTQLLFIQWLDDFQAHARMALPPADPGLGSGWLDADTMPNDADVSRHEPIGAVAVQLASLPPPIAEPGPAAPKPAAKAAELTPTLELQLSNGKAAVVQEDQWWYVVANEDPGSSYLEATPRGGSRRIPKGEAAGATGRLDGGAAHQRRVLPTVSAAVPPRVASLQLATEVLVQLRQGAEQIGGAGKPWGALLMLLSSCPGGERQELLLKALRVAAPMGDTAGQLARAVVEDDVQRTQEREITMLIREARKVVGGSLSVRRGGKFRDAFGSGELYQEQLGDVMGQAIEGSCLNQYWTSLCHLVYSSAEVYLGAKARAELRLGMAGLKSAGWKFGILAAQNAVLTLLLSRVVTPSILRAKAAAGVAPGTPLPERTAELSRLQRIAHFAHHEDQSSWGEATAGDFLRALQRKPGECPGPATSPETCRVATGAGREGPGTAARCPVPWLDLEKRDHLVLLGQEDSEAAALWIVETCRRWSAGVPSVPSQDTASPLGDPPGRARQQQQLQLAAGAFARLGDPAHASAAMPHPPRDRSIETGNGQTVQRRELCEGGPRTPRPIVAEHRRCGA